MEPTSTGAGGILAFKLAIVQTVIAALAGLLGYILIRPKTVCEAVWRFFGAGLASVVFGPFIVTIVHSHWPELLASAHALAADDGNTFALLYFTAPIQIASGLPIWLLMGIGARWLEKNRSITLGELFAETLDAVARSRNALKGDAGASRQDKSKGKSGHETK